MDCCYLAEMHDVAAKVGLENLPHYAPNVIREITPLQVSALTVQAWTQRAVHADYCTLTRTGR